MVLGSRDATFTFSNGFYLYGVCGFFFFGFTQVAEKLMIMYEECWDCNFKSIESLREANQRKVAVPHVRQVKLHLKPSAFKFFDINFSCPACFFQIYWRELVDIVLKVFL